MFAVAAGGILVDLSRTDGRDRSAAFTPISPIGRMDTPATEVVDERPSSTRWRGRVVEYFYPGKESLGVSGYDSTVTFYSTLDRLCPDDAVLLDYGAGRGEGFDLSDGGNAHGPHHALHWLSRAGRVGRRIGCDVDPVVKENPVLDEAHLLDPDNDYRIPLDNDSCDLVCADWVVEHLPDPAFTFAEVHRVLKPGGYFGLRTSNWYHYAYLAAWLLSDSKAEEAVLSVAQKDRQQRDVFPKLYRANTRRSLRRELRRGGFDSVTAYTLDPESAYMNFSAPTAILGGVYHRLASGGLLPRAVLLGFARKSS